MPGPISDSYDPEFGTSTRAAIVATAIAEVRDRITKEIGVELRHIVPVCESTNGQMSSIEFTERELRIIRFSLNRALESI